MVVAIAAIEENRPGRRRRSGRRVGAEDVVRVVLRWPIGVNPAPTVASNSEVMIDRMVGHADDLHRAADRSLMSSGTPAAVKPGGRAQQLDDQAFGRAALQSERAAQGELRVGDDLVFDHVDDVGVVPDRRRSSACRRGRSCR